MSILDETFLSSWMITFEQIVNILLKYFKVRVPTCNFSSRFLNKECNVNKTRQCYKL